MIRRGATRVLILAGAFVPFLLRAAEVHDSVEAQDTARLGELLAHDPGLVTAMNSAGLTPLQLAVRKGAVQAATFLVKNTQAAYFAAFLDVRTARGRAASASGDIAAAYEMFTTMLREDPGNEHVNFVQGLASFATERHSLAKLAFERALELNPNNDRAKAELGRTHLAMGNLDLAAKYLQEALSRSSDEETRRKIAQDLKRAGSTGSRWKAHGRVYVGYLDDSNVNVGPDSDIISIAPIIWQAQTLESLSVKDSSKPLDAQGGFLSVMLSESYDCGERGSWATTFDLLYYQNWLSGEPDYESTFGQVVLGMKRMRERDLWHVPLKLGHISSGHEPLVNMVGLHPRFIYVAGRAGEMQWQSAASLEFRDYDELDDRDGSYFSAEQSFKQLFGGGKHAVSMGLDLFHDHSDAGVYEHTGHAWSIGLDFSLPWGLALYSRGRYTSTDYSEKETLAPDDRSDTQNQLSVGMKKTLWGRLGLDVNYQQTENNSTFTLYQYDRSVTTVSASVRF